VYCAFASGAAIANSVNASVVEISDFDVLKAFPPSIAVIPKFGLPPFGAETYHRYAGSLSKDCKKIKTKNKAETNPENQGPEG
jgi:hypothetical protein